MKALISSLRPRQWIKNSFVLVPLIFSKYLFDVERVILLLTACAIFCFISGAIYLINDVADIDKDKKHPEKSKRPLASGKLKVSTAVATAIVLVVGSILSAFWLNLWLGVVIVSYFILNVIYSFYMKHIVILDVMSIAFGFVLRVLGGAITISVQPTSWIIICSALLALFLGFSKRRHELVILEENGNVHRKVLVHYSPYYLDQMISVVAASTVMSYILYTISAETVQRFGSTKLLLTVPFVFYGIFRYYYLVHKKGVGGDPTIALINDTPLIINVILWAVCASILIYVV